MIKVKIDSRKVCPGDTFVAIKGENFDGHDYIEDAIKNGATKIIAERGWYSVDTVLVPNTRTYLPTYLKELYEDEIKDLTLIGITGTNGKTTTAYLIYQALNKIGIKTSYIGTIGFYIDKKIFDLDRTTPESNEIYDMMLQSKDNGCKTVVMEVSSHSLVQERVKNLKFKTAIFTNLTSDHLDYHKTRQNYIDAKSLLFRQITKDGRAIINIDDECSKYMMLDENNNITYGFNESIYKILNYAYKNNKMYFDYKYKNETYNVMTNLLGKHNIYNLTALIATLHEFDIELNQINNLIPNLVAPPGRLEVINYKNNMIIIDYAHTFDAVKNVLNTAKEFSNGKIYCIIGCGGNRDTSKRSPMARVSLELSDRVILTSDNPRCEDASKIIDDMLNNNDMYSNYDIETDRSLAIKKGISMLNDNDILMILGKGHENYQIIGNHKYHFDDKEEVYKYIKKR